MAEQSKYTLVFDGNHFLFKTMYVIPTDKGKILQTEKDIDVYVRKLSMDFASLVRKFRTVADQVVFTIDASSWRKDFFPEAKYKGNRKPDEKINFENFKKGTERFSEILSSCGVILHKVPGAEGDDLCYAWSQHCNTQGKNCIIISGDGDLIQLVNKQESTEAHTLFYTSIQNKLMCYEGFSDFLNEKEEVTLFDMSSASSVSSNIRRIFNGLERQENLSINEVNTEKFIFKKILGGDKGDNVLPVYYYIKETKAGTRMYGISEAKATMILEEFEGRFGEFDRTYFFNKDYRNHIVNILIKIMKADKMTKETITENLIRNVNLIMLHPQTIPEPIQDQMLNNIEKVFEFKPDNMGKLTDMKKMLEGTQYLNIVNTTRTFDGLDDDSSDMSFIKKDGDEGAKPLF